MDPAPKVLFSLVEAAAMLSISLSSLQELRHRNIVKSIRMGRRFMIHRDEIERYAKRGCERIWAPKHEGKTVRFATAPKPEESKQLSLA